MSHRVTAAVLLPALLSVSASAFQDRRAGIVQVGQLAPDFTLAPRSGGAAVTLSSFAGKQPVALVFGSYT